MVVHELQLPDHCLRCSRAPSHKSAAQVSTFVTGLFYSGPRKTPTPFFLNNSLGNHETRRAKLREAAAIPTTAKWVMQWVRVRIRVRDRVRARVTVRVRIRVRDRVKVTVRVRVSVRNCRNKECQNRNLYPKAPVKSPSPTNQYPTFLQAGCPSSCPTNSVKSTEGRT